MEVWVKASRSLVEKGQQKTADDEGTPQFLEDARRNVGGGRLCGTRAARVAGRDVAGMCDKIPHSESRSDCGQRFCRRPCSWVQVALGERTEGVRLGVESTAATEDHVREAPRSVE